MSKDIKLDVTRLNAIQAECEIWKSDIQVVAWSNGEGFDIQLTWKNGSVQHMSITFSEFDILKKMVKKLDSL